MAREVDESIFSKKMRERYEAVLTYAAANGVSHNKAATALGVAPSSWHATKKRAEAASYAFTPPAVTSASLPPPVTKRRGRKPGVKVIMSEPLPLAVQSTRCIALIGDAASLRQMLQL